MRQKNTGASWADILGRRAFNGNLCQPTNGAAKAADDGADDVLAALKARADNIARQHAGAHRRPHG